MPDGGETKSPQMHLVNVHVNVEYCGVCDYGGHCLELARTIRESTPNATVVCTRGRRGSFEVAVNDKLIYSKLQTMALPEYGEVAQIINEASQGAPLRNVKGQQPVNCIIM